MYDALHSARLPQTAPPLTKREPSPVFTLDDEFVRNVDRTDMSVGTYLVVYVQKKTRPHAQTLAHLGLCYCMD
jgi:hypothetical protein